MRLRPDGSYRLPGLPAGPLRIEVLESYDSGGDFRPASTTHFGSTEGGWFRQSHGPVRGPQWMTVLPSFEANVRSNESLNLDLDLSQPGDCILKGRVTLNGSPLPFVPNDGGLFFPPTPHVRLFSGDTLRKKMLFRGLTGHMITYSDLGESAAFELRVHEPGSLCLDLSLPLSKEEKIHLSRPIELTAGVQEYQLALRSGSLVLRLAADQAQRSQHGLHLQRELPDGTQLSYFGPSQTLDGAARFDSVPEGLYQVLGRQGGQLLVLGEVSIVAGGNTTLELGEGD